ncbi:guanine nucleotide-binding protein alpha-4 subunit [Coprinopsis sp. MPI-PUGE-AT-0042]|nr:guanine nucleotide-binding protein alpha-4 subunit [Coprinopsis sp. MPI-PUGE-AT-0042]
MARFRKGITDNDHDPFADLLAPPVNETPEERERRLKAEAEALKRSQAIDEELKKQQAEERRERQHIRVLLLGQSESGKSTTLKNFQLMNSPKAFGPERASWRAVVHLNVVRSIRTILDLMTEVTGTSGRATPTSTSPLSSRPPSPMLAAGITLGPELLRLKMRLSPLQQVEEVLLRKLSPPGANELEATHLSSITNLPNAPRELAVSSNSQWKGAFSRLMTSVRTSIGSEADFSNDPNDPGPILHACAEDMITLWNDPTIKTMLRAYGVRLEDKPGFFLDSLERITDLKYFPSDDDILRARLKTLGVSEHRFHLKNTGSLVSNDWRVFDVGGARSLRAAWAPFFDNMDAIIFLAPLSGFDEVLSEDPTVNRLEDSVTLWKKIISNQLLKTAQTVLFLNKTDIFKAKLAAGILFGHYVVSYGLDKPNDYELASAYLKKKFAGIHKQYSPTPRLLYCHLTAVTDTRSTQGILSNVKDMVLRQALEKTKLV